VYATTSSWGSAASSHLSSVLLVADESAAAAAQDVGRLVRHARHFTLQLAESYLTGALSRQILGWIERLL